MSFHFQHFRDHLLRPALQIVDMWQPNVEILLLGTCATESQFGHYLTQEKSGPALGIYQMEPNTYDDLLENYLKRRDNLRQKIFNACDIPLDSHPSAERMVWDLRFATLMARLKYWTIPEPIPDADDLSAIADYYVRYYNAGGAATVEKFLLDYHKYVIGDGIISGSS